jgi:hypothetical protein
MARGKAKGSQSIKPLESLQQLPRLPLDLNMEPLNSRRRRVKYPNQKTFMNKIFQKNKKES